MGCPRTLVRCEGMTLFCHVLSRLFLCRQAARLGLFFLGWFLGLCQIESGRHPSWTLRFSVNPPELGRVLSRGNKPSQQALVYSLRAHLVKIVRDSFNSV